MSGFAKRIAHSQFERDECRIVGWYIEIPAYDQRNRVLEASDALHDFSDLLAMLEAVVSVILPKARRPEIEAKHRRIETYTEYLRRQTDRQLDFGMHEVRIPIDVAGMNSAVNDDRGVATPENLSALPEEFL